LAKFPYKWFSLWLHHKIEAKRKETWCIDDHQKQWVESHRYDISIPCPKPPLPNIWGSIICTIKSMDQNWNSLKQKKWDKILKSWDQLKFMKRKVNFHPDTNIMLSWGVLFQKYSRLTNEGSKVGVEWGKGFHYILHWNLTSTICIHSIHLFVEKISYHNHLSPFMNSHLYTPPHVFVQAIFCFLPNSPKYRPKNEVKFRVPNKWGTQ